jgi:hypothetical protein
LAIGLSCVMRVAAWTPLAMWPPSSASLADPAVPAYHKRKATMFMENSMAEPPFQSPRLDDDTTAGRKATSLTRY